ncbi:hypothetical protein [Larkinella arboricola]|nr:hypothetical protein [Larkinella arboricola]
MYEDIAQCLMDHAQRLPLSNCNEKQPYSHRHLEWIAVTAGAFFDKYPKLLTDDVLETLAIGKLSTKLEQFGHLKEFYPLNKALEGYRAYLYPKLKKHLFGPLYVH